MRIAVVIPTYNAAAFLEQTLASVTGQTVLPDEVIVVDDCSTDTTVEIAKTALAAIPHQVIRLAVNSGGPGKPMNAGIAATECDWIVTLDHDDELVSHRIERLKLLRPQCDLLIGRLIVRAESQDRGHLLDAAWSKVLAMTWPGEMTTIPAVTAYEGLAQHGCYAMSCSAMAFPKATWQAVGGFDETIATCIDFAFLEAVTRTMPLNVLQEPVAYWTWSERNLSHAVRRRVFEISTVMERINLPGHAKRKQAMLDRAYYLACRGEYRHAFRLLKSQGLQPRSPLIAMKCLAKAVQRNFTGRTNVQ